MQISKQGNIALKPVKVNITNVHVYSVMQLSIPREVPRAHSSQSLTKRRFPSLASRLHRFRHCLCRHYSHLRGDLQKPFDPRTLEVTRQLTSRVRHGCHRADCVLEKPGEDSRQLSFSMLTFRNRGNGKIALH